MQSHTWMKLWCITIYRYIDVYLVFFLRINCIACHLPASTTEGTWHLSSSSPRKSFSSTSEFLYAFLLKYIYRESISDNLIIQRIFASLIAKSNLVLLMLWSREGQPKGQIAYLLQDFPIGFEVCTKNEGRERERALVHRLTQIFYPKWISRAVNAAH